MNWDQMTLVQILADEKSVHIACDFRLTDARTGKPVQDTAHKLVTSAVSSGSALIGVTGIAHLDGKPIGTWIAEKIAVVSHDQSLDSLLELLRNSAEGPLASISDAQIRRTTFVVGSIIGTQSRVSLVSNFERFEEGRLRRDPEASARLTVSSVRPKGAQYFTTGVQGVVPRAEQEALKTLLRSRATDQAIQRKLADANAAASRLTNTVSEGCFVGSRDAQGRGSRTPFLTPAQAGDFIPPDFQRMLESAGLSLRHQIGPDGQPVPIQLKGEAFTSSGTGARYFREQFKLRPNDAELWNNYGVFLAGRQRLKEATSAFTRACELNTEYPVALSNLAQRLWQDQGNASEADRHFAEALRLSGGHVPGWLLAKYAAFCHEGLYDVARARDLYERACADDQFPLAKAEYGAFLLRTDGDRERAEELFAHALGAQSDNPEILGTVGLAEFLVLNRRDHGRALVERACVLAPMNAQILRSGGDVCLLSGDGETASYYYTRAVKRGANEWEVESNLGLALLIANKLEGAMRHLKRAARKARSEPAIRVNMAAVLWAQGERETALEVVVALLAGPLPIDLEAEALAMLHFMDPRESTERLMTLMAEGAKPDAMTLIGMSSRGEALDRERGKQLAALLSTHHIKS